jgi:hypothetical protein
MNKQEARVLHGVYFDRQYIENETFYNCAEIYWLTVHPLAAGRNWRDTEGRLQSASPSDDPFSSIAKTRAAAIKPLAYLQGAEFLTYQVNGDAVRVSLSIAGANRARELGSMFGRINLRYREQKDGLIGLLITIIVAAVTAYITTVISGK